MNATWEITRWPFPLLNDSFMLILSTFNLCLSVRHFCYDYWEQYRHSDGQTTNISMCTSCAHPPSPGCVPFYWGLLRTSGDRSSQIRKTPVAFMLAVTFAGIVWMVEWRQNLPGLQRGRRWRSWKGKATSVTDLRLGEQTHCINSWETHRQVRHFLATWCKARAVRWVTISTWTGRGQFEAVHARADRVGQLYREMTNCEWRGRRIKVWFFRLPSFQQDPKAFVVTLPLAHPVSHFWRFASSLLNLLFIYLFACEI